MPSRPNRQATKAAPRGVLLYNRKSTVVTEKRSLAEQDTAGERKATDLFPGLPIVDRYYEEASAWAESRRPTFNKALARAEAENLVIITWTIDRFSRQGAEAVIPLLKRDAPVRLVTVDGDDTADKESRLIIVIKAELALKYSDQLSANVLRAKAADRAAGKWVGGFPPFGYVIGPDRKLLFAEDELPTLRLMIDLALQDQTGHAIARRLNELGVRCRPTKKQRDNGEPGNEWSPNSVLNLLENPVLCGWLTYNGDVVRDDKGNPVKVGPAAMTPSQRQRILRLIGNRTVIGGDAQKRGKRSAAELSHLLFCECAAPMHLCGRSYRCSAFKTGGSVRGNTMLAANLEGFVARQALLFLHMMLDSESETFQLVHKEWTKLNDPTAEDEKEDIDRRIAVATAHLAELRKARYERHEFETADEIAEYDSWYRHGKETVAALTAKRATIVPPEVDPDQLRDWLRTLLDWPEMPKDQRRTILRLCIKHVTLHYPTKSKHWDSDRIETEFIDGKVMRGSFFTKV